VIAAADHPVAAHGVSAYATHLTRELVSAAVAGVGVGVTAARTAGLGWRVVDAGVAGGPVAGALSLRPVHARGDLVTGPAMTAVDTDRLVDEGRRLGTEVSGAGIVALGEIGVANTTVAAALACALTGAAPEEVTGLGAAADSAMVARKHAVVTAAVHRFGGPGAGARDPLGSLAQLGGPEIAVLTGVVLGAARAGAAVVVDGFAVGVAALVAVLTEPGVQGSLIAGQRSREPGSAIVLQHLGCEPLLDLRLRAGEGVGAVLAVALLLHAMRLRRGAARVDH
jgi:nicotinate-nucleotide--dimethylbenzimidazole phosphoribosyltransferase